MNKIYHLANCKTCQKIIVMLNNGESCTLQNIKETNISAQALDDLAVKVGSYEALFSRKAMKYRSLGLDKLVLTEPDYRKWMLEEYTFLKRPFVLIGEEVFIGNAQKTIDAAKKALG
jgi:arsenate reductase (glutaredoxin)